jgi:Tn3 transposase DDE domain
MVVAVGAQQVERVDADDHLVIPKLTAEDVPAEAKELKDELSGMLPFAPIASLLIELDGRTNFLDCFTHAGGKKLAHSPELKRNILAVLIALATNLGLAKDVGGVRDLLRRARVDDAVLRPRGDAPRGEHLHRNHHYGLELAGVFGGGTMSSSDRQRFPVRGKSLSARDMIIHGGRVLSTYTHVSDQWSTYGTKIIVPTVREAHYALDEFLGNTTDLPITEHATDTHGAILINFGLFDLVGKALTPRMRDLTKITLVRDDTPTEIGKLYPHAGSLLPPAGGPDQRLLARSVVDGRVMAAALKEWGMLRRTIHTAKYLSDPAYRRRISRQLARHSDNINFFGVINVDIEAEMAKLSGGWRPLRPAQLRNLGLWPGLYT